MPYRTIRLVLLALVLTVVVGVFGLLAVFWIKSSVIEKQVKQEALPRLSQALGKQVKADDMDIDLFPPRVEVNNVVISGKPGEPPIAILERVRVSMRVWPLLRSAGQEISFRSITLINPQINLVRGKDGTWNYQTIPMQESEREVLVSNLRVQNGEIHIIDRSGQRQKEQPETVAVKNIDLRVKDLSGDEARIFLNAAVMADEQNFQADLSRKKGDWAGEMRLESLDVNHLQGLLPAGIDEAITGGKVGMQATLNSGPEGKQLVEGQVQIPDLALRGNAKQVNTAFDFMVTLPSIENGSLSAEITDLQINGPEVIVLSGTGTISGEPLVANFSLAGPLVDLDALLGVLPTQETPTPILALPASVRGASTKLRATGKLEVDRLIIRNLSASNVVANAELQGGVLTVTRATANLYGGKMDASNTVVNLTEPLPSWELHSSIQHMNIGYALQEITGESIIVGDFNGRIDLQVEGDQWEHLKTSMTGNGSFTLIDGSLNSISIEKALTGSIAEVLKIGEIAGAGLPPRTPFQSIKGSFSLKNGQMFFLQPIRMRSSMGNVSLLGSLGLDQQLRFQGTTQLSPEFVEEVAGIRPSKPIDAPFTLTGLLSSPQIRVDSSVIAEQMVKQALPGNIF